MDVRFPIGDLQVPEQIMLEDVQKWLGEIKTYSERLRETVAGLSEEELNKTYRDGSYTVLQLVHHITDSQINMFQRLKMALTDDNPVVPAFDQDKWAVTADTELPAAVSINILDALNERIIALGNSITEEELKRTFTLQGGDTITVGKKLAKLSWHEEHHLAHIKIALEN